MKRIKGRDGVMREVDDDYIIQDGESFTIPLTMMDSRSIIHDGTGRPAGQRPGFLFGDGNDQAELDAAHAQYRHDLEARWQSGRWQSGPSKPAPSAAPTHPNPEAGRDAAYLQYRRDIEERWRR